MNWNPKECKRGDIIRIKIGSFYHYGIFVNEERIIQFGLPPIPQYKLPDSEIRVCVSDIDVFSCNEIVEVAEYTRQEKKKKFSGEEIVARAEEKIGMDGYSLLHNNCEHFVTYCAFNEKHCVPEEEALKRWRNRPVFDLFFASKSSSVPEKVKIPTGFFDSICKKEKTSAETLGWYLLKKGLGHSLKLNFDDIQFKKTYGRSWKCKDAFFSREETENDVFVLISNSPCAMRIIRDESLKSSLKDKTAVVRDVTFSFQGEHNSFLKCYEVNGNQVSIYSKEKKG